MIWVSRSQVVSSNQSFFPVGWELDRENNTVFVQFWKNSKEHGLDKLRKFILNQHFIQTFYNYCPSSGNVFRNFCTLHIQFLYLKFLL